VTDLERIQRWMQDAITDIDSAADAEALETILTRSRALSAAERLAVYTNAYHARLLEVLRQEFAVAAHAFGDADAFDAITIAYIRDHPPTSYTLGDLGRDFPRYLRDTRPERDGDGPDWADFLVDVAELERVIGEVFDGPGIEERPPLTSEMLSAIPADAWLGARLEPVPCLRLLRLSFPVADYHAAVRRDGDAEAPEARETFVAVTRRRYVVRTIPLTSGEYAVLGALVEGRTVAEALTVAVAESAEAEELQMWFRRWAEEGFFVGVKGVDAC
jgi:Putative DNA-binding domain